MPEPLTRFRVFEEAPRTIYDEGCPVLQVSTPEEAARLVGLLNSALKQTAEPDTIVTAFEAVIEELAGKCNYDTDGTCVKVLNFLESYYTRLRLTNPRSSATHTAQSVPPTVDTPDITQPQPLDSGAALSSAAPARPEGLDIELLKGLCSDATPGTFSISPNIRIGKDGGKHGYLEIVSDKSACWIARVQAFHDGPVDPASAEWAANAELFTAACTAIPLLITYIESLERALAEKAGG